MRSAAFDLTLYLVAGEADCAGRPLEEVVTAAVRGGVTLVQLREKSAPEARQVAAARRLKALLAPAGVPLIVNDSLDVALAAEADGLHLGQDDSDPAAARAALGPSRILGLSVGTPEELARSDLSGVDYLGVGPVFATASKDDAGAAIGLEGLRDLRRRCDLPMVAIGGIKREQATAIAACGFQGVAVVSAICAAPDPAAAARDLLAAFRAGR